MVQDYPRPPRLEPVAQALRVDFAGVTRGAGRPRHRVARARDPSRPHLLTCPPASVLSSALVPSSRETFCEWKGRAVYFDLVVNGRRSRKRGMGLPGADRALRGDPGSPRLLRDIGRRGLGRRHQGRSAAWRFLRWLGHAEPDRQDQGGGGNAALVGLRARRAASRGR